MSPEHRRVLLNAEWRNLVMVNCEVDADVLAGWLPPGVELDAWRVKGLSDSPQGSLFGLRFRRVAGRRVLGPVDCLMLIVHVCPRAA